MVDFKSLLFHMKDECPVDQNNARANKSNPSVKSTQRVHAVEWFTLYLNNNSFSLLSPLSLLPSIWSCSNILKNFLAVFCFLFSCRSLFADWFLSVKLGQKAGFVFDGWGVRRRHQNWNEQIGMVGRYNVPAMKRSKKHLLCWIWSDLNLRHQFT